MNKHDPILGKYRESDSVTTGLISGATGRFGALTNYSAFESDGSYCAYGEATTFEDCLADITQVRSTGPGVSLNVSENNIEFTDASSLSDYILMNYQLPHKWKSGSNLFPHIHWQQTSIAVPNFLIQYRWQRNNQLKTTDWSNLKCTTVVFNWSTGTLNQISYSIGITPPTSYYISDIIQFRVLRDNANTSTAFTGLDTYSGVASISAVDIHYEADTLGSRSEYSK